MSVNKPKLLATLIAGALAHGGVNAQALEEVVVTAQHRPENLQSIPVTVSALSSIELEQANIFDAASIAVNVPGMAYAEFAPGQALISMRGISSVDDGAGLDNSVSLFLDGVYIGRLASINFDMFDLERIEVLRGPQGTLFGRNSIGGAINVISSKPEEEFGGKIGVTAGNQGILRYQGFVTGALSENLSGKFTINHREHDGFVRNVILNKDQQDEDQTSLRGQLLWTGERSEWLLSADWMDDDREDMGRTPIDNNAPLLQIAAANDVNDVRQNAAPADGFSKREASGISLQGDIDYAKGTLTSITAIRRAETDWEMASVGAPLGVLGLPFDEVIDDIVEDIDTFSQEFRWTSNLDGAFNYTAGFYYLQEDTDRIEQFKITAAGTPDPNVPLRQLARGNQNIIGNEVAGSFNETTSYAVYAQGTYDFSDRLRLTFGARFTYDEKDYRANSINCGGDRTGTPFENSPFCQGVGGSLNIIAESFDVSASDDWSDFSPKVALQYDLNNDSMIFGSISRGYKSGGFGGSQGIASAAIRPVDQETALNYEIGYKGDLLDNTMRFNVTAFYTDYEDLQVVRFGPVPDSEFGTFITTNIGSADITGVEAELTWNASEFLSFSGNVAVLDTEVNDIIINNTDVSGSDLRQAPDLSYNLVANYEMPTDNGDWNFRLQFSHTDDQINDYIDQRTRVEEFSLLDARIGWTSPSGTWDVALWGQNLTDDDYISHSYVIGPGVIGVWGAPRTYGLTVNYGF